MTALVEIMELLIASGTDVNRLAEADFLFHTSPLIKHRGNLETSDRDV
jgi:hypothetical protein